MIIFSAIFSIGVVYEIFKNAFCGIFNELTEFGIPLDAGIAVLQSPLELHQFHEAGGPEIKIVVVWKSELN